MLSNNSNFGNVTHLNFNLVCSNTLWFLTKYLAHTKGRKGLISAHSFRRSQSLIVRGMAMGAEVIGCSEGCSQ